jgi:hypothetical protein
MASRLEVVSQRTKKIGHAEFTIVQDQKTGVLYAYGQSRSDGGLVFTPLIDAAGKPVVETLDYVEY